MFDYEILQHVLEKVRERQEDLKSQAETGSVENWSMYQNIVGQLQSLAYVESEIQSLLKRLDRDNE
tara:strand:+ start:195 stop:392 length:198 start_codon:yes stop_codon:yes gene_type:complete